MDFLKKHKTEIAIFALALAARLFYLGISVQANGGQWIHTISGSDCYFAISQNIDAGNGYSCSGAAPYTLNSMRPPVQPYFIAIGYHIFHSYWPPLLLQMILGSIVPIFGMMITGYLTKRRGAALAVGILLALEPAAILLNTTFYSETVFTFLFLLSVLCVFRYMRDEKAVLLAASGLSLGLATLTKPTSEYMPILFAAFLLWHYRREIRQKLLPIVLFLLVFALAIAPWVYRNRLEFGVASLSPQLGEELYVQLVPSVLSFEHKTPFQQEFDAILAQGGVDPNQASVENDSLYLHRAIKILSVHPIGLTLISANTALSFFVHDGMIDVLRHLDIHPAVPLGAPALFLLLSNPLRLISYISNVFWSPFISVLIARIAWIVITICAFLGAIRLFRQKNLYAIMSAAIVLYFMLTTLVIGMAVNARYRVPVNALILAFAVYEICETASSFRSGKRFSALLG